MIWLKISLGTAALVSATVFLIAPAPAEARGVRTVTDGKARFQMISPTLVRLEFAADGQFENRRTLTTDGRLGRKLKMRTRISKSRKVRVIRTSKMVVRWTRSADGFDGGALRVKLGNRKLRPKLGPNPAPLGGWRRSLDLVDGPVPLNEGMLSREGWYLLDDSETALIEGDGFSVRQDRSGSYQDLYLFAYGDNYIRGLRDLRKLTGAAPLLPRKAFGIWFSRWWPYADSEWKQIAARFEAEGVPLDTISLDTDFKSINDPAGAAIAATAVGAEGLPYSWNGWDWNPDVFPDPKGFLDWADGQGLEVGLNIHPSINSTDPRFPAAQNTAQGGLTPSDSCRVVQADPDGQCMVFDWTDPNQLKSFFDLHEGFEDDGDVFWWLDWCCDGSSANAKGLTADTWINRQYSEHQRERGSRWPSFQRIGGSYQAGFGGNGGTGIFAEHRYTLAFTGDTCGSWPLIGFAAEVTAAEASIGMPYVSHDIGSFHSVSPTGVCDKDASPLLTPRFNSLPAEMYVRWVQLGAFQPILRLHSHHGKRLPWEYPGQPGEIAAEFLRLRETLVPYLYTLARRAHDSGVPIVRPLYLGWPGEDEAYEHPSQYSLGKNVLVAPVSEPGDPVQHTVWFPPGSWVDWFTGETFKGPMTKQISVPLDRMPVYVKRGSVIPTQPEVSTTPEGPAKTLVLRSYAGTGRGHIYDDSGRRFAYEKGQFGKTAISQWRDRGTSRLTIRPTRGTFNRQPAKRRYEIKLIGVDKPSLVRVGGKTSERFTYDTRSRTVTIKTGKRPISRVLRVRVR